MDESWDQSVVLDEDHYQSLNGQQEGISIELSFAKCTALKNDPASVQLMKENFSTLLSVNKFELAQVKIDFKVTS